MEEKKQGLHLWCHGSHRKLFIYLQDVVFLSKHWRLHNVKSSLIKCEMRCQKLLENSGTLKIQSLKRLHNIKGVILNNWLKL